MHEMGDIEGTARLPSHVFRLITSHVSRISTHRSIHND